MCAWNACKEPIGVFVVRGVYLLLLFFVAYKITRNQYTCMQWKKRERCCSLRGTDQNKPEPFRVNVKSRLANAIERPAYVQASSRESRHIGMYWGRNQRRDGKIAESKSTRRTIAMPCCWDGLLESNTGMIRSFFSYVCSFLSETWMLRQTMNWNQLRKEMSWFGVRVTFFCSWEKLGERERGTGRCVLVCSVAIGYKTRIIVEAGFLKKEAVGQTIFVSISCRFDIYLSLSIYF